MNSTNAVLDEVRSILGSTLQLGSRALALNEHTALIGAIPEFDSMAVVTVITTIEERFGIAIADDEISGETFATLGELARFVEGKLER